MREKTRLKTCVQVMTLCAALSGQLFAATFTVTNADDSWDGDPENCTLANQPCSLRDALAAADLYPDHDLVVFDIEDPIYLVRNLTTVQPVTIDGGGTTVVRVHQGYVISILPDLYGENLPIATLQPTYYSERAFNRPMLEVSGSGSVVRGLVLDGSITPEPADVGVERIDYESNGSVDRFLLTIDSSQGGPGFKKRWLISGGITCQIPWGTVEISNNELRNFNDTAIWLNGTFSFNPEELEPVVFPVISGNVISGGAGELGLESTDGIWLTVVVGAEVAHNTVEDFRNGLSAFFFSGLRATGNDFIENRTGVDLQYGEKLEFPPGSGVFHPNVFDDNLISGNLDGGLSATVVSDSEVTNNEVSGNGSHPGEQGGILLFNSSSNTIAGNEIERNSGFGLVIDGHYDENLFLPVDFAEANYVAYNEVNSNGGAGIVLLFNAFDNIVEYNESNNNTTGIVAGFVAPFPSGNEYEGNEFKNNSGYDVVDFDPNCNDTWVANSYDTVVSSELGGCFE